MSTPDTTPETPKAAKTRSAGAPPLWELRNITKVFPGVRANDGVSLTLREGRIHGLLGENGCGKSTLIKILSGVYQPDSGEVLHRGEAMALTSATAARADGIATVYQEFSLIPQLTVAENIVMGRHPRRFGLIVDWPAVRRQASEILARLDLAIDPDAKVGDLSVAEQQLVEIAKALSQRAELLILDEPTTALGQDEIVTLHRFLRKLRDTGVCILYISHRLDEVLALVDDFTILKDGRVASPAGGTDRDVDAIVQRMIGADVRDHYPKERHATDRVVLELKAVRTAAKVVDASFTLREGEVLGLGGVIGSGRTEIARAIFGADRVTGGELVIDGRPRRISSPADAIRNGIALVPENRKYDGLFPNFFAGPNITMARTRGIMRGPFLDRRREDRITTDYVDDLQITPLARNKYVTLISGGNQQKVLLARWMFTDARIVILDEPTQGIDIGAKLAVYNLINDLTRSGKSVVLISSVADELIAMSDRVALVKHGRVVDVRPAADVTPGELISAAESAHIGEHTPVPERSAR
ncbi:sugar ABC transporter ATP-binding protein [Streptomyces sp. NPDC004065]|uniref:sugar ABC transporter ATP-binding protein n=1 Tax=Streptomyces sp. NPDC004065 TaxID=3364689 RepID=UPI00384AEAA5